MRSASTRVATFQNTRVCHGAIRCVGRPSSLTIAISSALVSIASNSAAARSGRALGCELGAHDVVQLDRQLVPRVEQSVAARLEHALEAAVAQKEGALAVL